MFDSSDEDSLTSFDEEMILGPRVIFYGKNNIMIDTKECIKNFFLCLPKEIFQHIQYYCRMLFKYTEIENKSDLTLYKHLTGYDIDLNNDLLWNQKYKVILSIDCKALLNKFPSTILGKRKLTDFVYKSVNEIDREENERINNAFTIKDYEIGWRHNTICDVQFKMYPENRISFGAKGGGCLIFKDYNNINYERVRLLYQYNSSNLKIFTKGNNKKLYVVKNI